MLEITRELGSWVKVSWPAGEDGVGYVHTSTGSRSDAVTTASGQPGRTPMRHASVSDARPATVEPAAHVTEDSQPSLQPAYVSLPTHLLGLGGRTGDSTLGSGASARSWFRHRLGLQVEVSRSALTSPATPGRFTATQVAPSLLYALPDRVTDYVWVRPYVGAGPRLLRHSVSLGPQINGVSVAENSMGLQAFGGGELTFSGLSRFALSADLRYNWAEAPAAGFDLGGLGVALSGHWYIK